jgi:hypothetical protein
MGEVRAVCGRCVGRGTIQRVVEVFLAPVHLSLPLPPGEVGFARARVVGVRPNGIRFLSTASVIRVGRLHHATSWHC